MAKFSIKKGDKINAQSSAAYDENPPYSRVGGNTPYEKPLTVSKVFDHGVRTKEKGYINNKNILEIVNE